MDTPVWCEHKSQQILGRGRGVARKIDRKMTIFNTKLQIVVNRFRKP
jgi:hypothetical protein